jgi:hypothetical protein
MDGRHSSRNGYRRGRTWNEEPALLSTFLFLARLSPTERRRTLDLAKDVTAASEDWLRDFPIVRRKPVTAACGLAAAVALPTLDVPELTLLARWWLWIFGIDDRFDDVGVAYPELTDWIARFEETLWREPRLNDADLLIAAFESIRGDLRHYPLFGSLGAEWHRGMAGIVRGMLTEREWHDENPPSFELYLENGIKTISMRPYALTACVVADEPTAAAVFRWLDPMIYRAARCFRLANDLRSDAREREEGKLNAVSLLQRRFAAIAPDDNQALEKARAEIRDACAADLVQLGRMQERAAPSIRTMARFLWEHTAFVLEMYEAGDYDTMSELLDEGAIT